MLIQTNNLTKIYRMDGVEVHALRGVSLTVEEGDFLAVMGASGSGKSTLMNILGCLDRPTSGTYSLAGQDVSTLSRDALARLRNQTIGFVFQNFNLLSRTTALENVELPLFYGKHLTGKERAHRAFEMLKKVGLDGREKHYPSQLSGGQQQRVAIARALINEPSIILADEPTGNLDTRSSVEIMTFLQQLNREGITIVMITHEPDIAKYARRNLLMRDGLVVEDKQVEARRVTEQ
jgi:putative ABC transport system ATP-binding protein